MRNAILDGILDRAAAAVIQRGQSMACRDLRDIELRMLGLMMQDPYKFVQEVYPWPSAGEAAIKRMVKRLK